jgi:hypothetical protein
MTLVLWCSDNTHTTIYCFTPQNNQHREGMLQIPTAAQTFAQMSSAMITRCTQRGRKPV